MTTKNLLFFFPFDFDKAERVVSHEMGISEESIQQTMYVLTMRNGELKQSGTRCTGTQPLENVNDNRLSPEMAQFIYNYLPSYFLTKRQC